MRSQKKYRPLMDDVARQRQLSEFTKALQGNLGSEPTRESRFLILFVGLTQNSQSLLAVKKKKELMSQANNEKTKKELIQEKKKLTEKNTKIGLCRIFTVIIGVSHCAFHFLYGPDLFQRSSVRKASVYSDRHH